MYGVPKKTNAQKKREKMNLELMTKKMKKAQADAWNSIYLKDKEKGV